MSGREAALFDGLEAAVDGFDQQPSRYIVGIDLGTTNCAVAFLDTHQPGNAIQSFPIEQWVDVGVRERRELLPSFLYQPLPDELESLRVAGRESSFAQIVGSLARDRGLRLPGRQVSSAKSWLCHAGVDRRSPILPWQSEEGVERVSPVDASAAYLQEIRLAWDQMHRDNPLADQDIVLTLPASFDQVARQLTIEAAAKAGLRRVLPIEEPQAAFYAWLSRHGSDWEQQVQCGQTILVCDIGGGTTDFTLIRVRAAASTETTEPLSAEERAQSDHAKNENTSKSSGNKLTLHRVAVGQHLILGGDNIDLALAKTVERKLTGGSPLPARSWDALRQSCRQAKETLLGAAAPKTYTIHLPSTGSRLIGGGSQVAITVDEVRSCVLDGFFPRCRLADRPQVQSTGFQEFGLPFAADAGITRHLASFLWDHRHDGRSDLEIAELSDVAAARPDWVLFNGGVMTSSQLVERVIDVVGSWFAEQDGMAADWRPQILDGDRLDLAVARGAAYFGQVRRGNGVEIEAKLACSYYLQTSIDPPAAVCIVPGSATLGEKFRLADRAWELSLGQPVQFPLAYSTTRLSDRIGQSVELDPEHFAELPPIRTVIEWGSKRRRETLPVFVEVELTQIGTLQLYLHACESDNRWKLEFDVRGSTQTDQTLSEATANQAGVLDQQTEQRARNVVAQTFSEKPATAGRAPKPSQLMSRLSEAVSLRKADWPPNLLRSIWSALMDHQAGRRQSAAHEARWLNLLGYALRPGYGLAADDWRVAETWRAVHGKLAFPAASSRNESLILWRRIAGGFTAGQQLTVYQQIAGPLRDVLDPLRRGKGGGVASPHELIELLRLVGSLELLPKSEKSQLGDWLLQLLGVKKWAACQASILWTLGRLGSRAPTYGPLNCVTDAEHVSTWLTQLVQLDLDDPNLPLALMLSARLVGDRYRDVSPQIRQSVHDKLVQLAAPAHYVELVVRGGQLHNEEATQILGEALPLGLRLK